MSRCDCEGVFYRVFCVSLLIIAFSFTVILTNVFVDIDHLLSKRERESTESVAVIEHVSTGYEATTEVQDYYIGVDTNGEGKDRSKRSIDSENFFLHINSPKTKNDLTKKLAALLEALDGDDVEALETTPKTETGNIFIKTVKQKNNIEINQLPPEDRLPQMQLNENLMYLALHDMLDGIGNVDMQDLIDRMQSLVRSYKHEESSKKSSAKTIAGFHFVTTPKDKIDLNEELNQMDHLLKHKFGDKRVWSNAFSFNDESDSDKDKGTKKSDRTRNKKKNPTYIIKTLINIEKDGKINSNEDLQGIIRLMYNGKPIKIRGEDSFGSIKATTTTTTLTPTTTKHSTKEPNNTVDSDVEEFADVLKEKFKSRHMSDNYLKMITMEYLKKFSKSNDSVMTVEKKKIRIKRNIESNEKEMETPHTKDDDELFVEIETHFDKNGIEGEKKRKLVNSLIEKIQNAIGKNSENAPINGREREPLLKRIQSPLDRNTVTDHPKTPVSSAYRTLDPISKTMPIADPLPLVTNRNGETWKNQYSEPKFLSLTKSINSAELNQVAVDYTQSDKYPVIPKRVQLPLSTDTSQETTNTNDVSKLHLLIKDIQGTGFSIGYNQYVDQAPDPESIKLFHGIENIVKNYHQMHDNSNQDEDHESGYEIYGQEMKKREVKSVEAPQRAKRFVINRQNTKQFVKKINDYRQNEYIYKDHYHSYDTFKEVSTSKSSSEFQENNLQGLTFKRSRKSSRINGHRKKRSITFQTIMNSNKKMRVNKFLNTNAFPRQQRYFKLAKRGKRQIGKTKAIDKTDITNENNNMFIVSDGDVYDDNLVVRRRQVPDLFFIELINSNKEKPFLKNAVYFQPNNHPFSSHTFQTKNENMYNPNPMFLKNDFLKKEENKERNKRQLHTLRIIDRGMGLKISNDDYGDGIFAKKAETSELDEPQIIPQGNEEKVVQHNRMDIFPFLYRNPFTIGSHEHTNMRNKNPIKFASKNMNTNQELSLSERAWENMDENPLMAKYPHVFKDVGTIEERPHGRNMMFSKVESKDDDTLFDDEELYKSSNVRDLVKAVMPTRKNNYKVTIRLVPQDVHKDSQPMFKEVHTSINKTFNKNGVQYFSLLNVSEISNAKIPNNHQNRTHNCSHHFESTTPNTVTSTVQDENNEKHDTPKMARNQTNEITDATTAMGLVDIVLPSTPRKVYRLTVADLSKLICSEMKSQNSQKSSPTQTTQSDKSTRKTTTTSATTIIPTVTTIRKTVNQESATTQTVDPLKIKLLKAISQNEHLTSQILNRIDQNTDVLQTFLSKITSEIAKLPNIAHQERAKNNNPTQNEDNNAANFYTTTMTNINPVAYVPQETTNIKPVTPHHYAPMHEYQRAIEGMPQPLKPPNEARPKQERKFFFDDAFVNNKTISPDLPISRRRMETDLLLGEDMSKLDTDLILDTHMDNSRGLHRLNNVDNNAILQNNVGH